VRVDGLELAAGVGLLQLLLGLGEELGAQTEGVARLGRRARLVDAIGELEEVVGGLVDRCPHGLLGCTDLLGGQRRRLPPALAGRQPQHQQQPHRDGDHDQDEAPRDAGGLAAAGLDAQLLRGGQRGGVERAARVEGVRGSPLGGVDLLVGIDVRRHRHLVGRVHDDAAVAAQLVVHVIGVVAGGVVVGDRLLEHDHLQIAAVVLQPVRQCVELVELVERERLLLEGDVVATQVVDRGVDVLGRGGRRCEDAPCRDGHHQHVASAHSHLWGPGDR
jgi:hypothetical protein